VTFLSRSMAGKLDLRIVEPAELQQGMAEVSWMILNMSAWKQDRVKKRGCNSP